ncbi:MAG: hypothetical protein HUJ26_03145 [Planctomycetaceae bacterium]|nr:hypothetical protein [Planctomycetaceae bacterium]
MANAESPPKINHHQPVGLVPLLDARWAWGGSAVVSTSLLSLCWLMQSYLPLAPGRLWAHFSTSDHFPLLSGVDGAARQFALDILLQKTSLAWGVAGVSLLLSCCIMFSLCLMFVLFNQIHNRHLISSASVALVGFQLALSAESVQASFGGIIAYALLLGAMTHLGIRETKRSRFWTIMITGLAMFLWVNSSGSFTVGIIILCGACLENVVRAIFQKKSIRGIWSDWCLRNYVYALEAGMLGLLCNPQGIKVLLHADYLNGFVSDYASRWWIPLVPGNLSTVLTGALIVGVLVLLRTSRASLVRGFPLSCFVLWGLTWLDRSALIWSVPLTVLMIQPLLAERISSIFPERQDVRRDSRDLTSKDFRYTLLTLLPIWLGFALSPLGGLVLGGTSRGPDQIISRETPVNLASHLRSAPPLGQVVHPTAWGDWLSFAGPEQIQLFLSLENLGRCPQTLFRDQRDILHASLGWEKKVERYRINSIILDAQQHSSTVHVLENSPTWEISYQDEQAVMFRRRMIRDQSGSAAENL